MTGKTHQIIGITAGLGSYLILSQPTYGPAALGAVVAASSIGALFPDVDSPASKLWSMLPLGRFWSRLLDPFLAHRHISHSLLGLGLVSWGAWWVVHLFPPYWGIPPYVVWQAWTIAYASHLVADSFTVEGIPLLFPIKGMIGIPPKPFEGVRIVTGKWFENLIIFPLVNIILIALLIAKWPVIKLILFH